MSRSGGGARGFGGGGVHFGGGFRPTLHQPIVSRPVHRPTPIYRPPPVFHSSPHIISSAAISSASYVNSSNNHLSVGTLNSSSSSSRSDCTSSSSDHSSSDYASASSSCGETSSFSAARNSDLKENIRPPLYTPPTQSQVDEATARTLDSEFESMANRKLSNACCWSTCFFLLALVFSIIMTISVAATKHKSSVEMAYFEQVLTCPLTRWTSSVQVKSQTSEVESILLSKKPSLIRTDTDSFEKTISIGSNLFRYEAFRLWQGSKIAVSFQAKPPLVPDFYLVKVLQRFKIGKRASMSNQLLLAQAPLDSHLTLSKTKKKNCILSGKRLNRQQALFRQILHST